MKIAYIDPYPVPDYRVASLQILQNVDAFARQGADVYLVTPEGKNTVEEILGRSLSSSAKLISLRNIRRKWYFPLNTQKMFYFQVSSWLKKNRIDAVFTRNLKMAKYLLCKHPEIPLFFESHEVFAQSFKESHDLSKNKDQHKYEKLRETEHLVYSQSRVVFVLTSLLRDDIINEYKVDTSIVVTPDGVDMLAVESISSNELALTNHKLPTQILYLGSLHRWKGVPTAIKAMSHLEDAVLNIAGGEPEQIQQLRQIAQQIGVCDRVNFLGFIQPKLRFQIIADNDICLLPLTKTSIGSRYTSPLKLFEYMAMGKPVVISDFPSIRDVVDENAVSFADSENAESFAQQIQLLRDNSERVKAQVSYAKMLVTEHLNWDKRARLIMQTISKDISA
ncbi:glycosyltransferase [Photorhabdus temperata]|uniref:Glycosyltransferase n=2 Tax=Photorhabdus temperata TaxID=574560 RepID=A0A081RXE5_PHOTE|nr:glycosyltransferase [Photorhabdus temperata]ERT14349.1 WalM protein [Photorhabdus temperata J3]KER03348.1 glycosyltransferase [Photorhabdus temperata subsp. temperata Meg1]MCT8346757.1 glycosyltransferase [Photorhabdus temperata]